MLRHYSVPLLHVAALSFFFLSLKLVKTLIVSGTLISSFSFFLFCAAGASASAPAAAAAAAVAIVVVVGGGGGVVSLDQ